MIQRFSLEAWYIFNNGFKFSYLIFKLPHIFMSEQVNQFILNWDQFCHLKVVKNILWGGKKEIWNYRMCPLLLVLGEADVIT